MGDAFGALPPSVPWGINFGGGVNSTALLILARERELRPDWVLFADTGSERPETYENVAAVREWCGRVGFPFAVVRWVRRDGSFEPIHENALRTAYLPSKAYGLSGCTFKWKIQPMQKWRKTNGFSATTVAIGYDAGEKRRIQSAKKRACEEVDLSPAEQWWYPLVAWRVNRAECERVVKAAGFQVIKSSCFLCPNMKPAEWEALKHDHPPLYAIAEEVQRRAEAAGHADTATLFRSYKAGATCVCFADGCGLPAPARGTEEKPAAGETGEARRG